MNPEQLQDKRETIQDHALNSLNQYLGMDLTGVDPKMLGILFNRAKLGMAFEKEMNLSKRALENNIIRIGRLIYEDKKELKTYIQKSMPKYSII